MRAFRWITFLTLIVSMVSAETSWNWSVIDSDANDWHTQRLDMSASAGQLDLHSEDDLRGIALICQKPSSRCVSMEADVKISKRLCKEGWNYAGVTLYQDDANLWMLALVEGPNGDHSIDFIENHAGLWQAQNLAETVLKREGTISFSWVAGESYKLRLSICDGAVRAQVADVKDNRVIGKAFFRLTDVPAVRYGRPGLILSGSAATVCNVRVGSPASPPIPVGFNLEQGPAGELALLDDDLPGHDRAANALLADAFRKKGFGVTSLSAKQLITPDLLTADTFDIVVVPQCQLIPIQADEVLAQYAKEGGHMIFLGGPMSSESLFRVEERWLDKKGQSDLFASVVPLFRPFAIGPDFDTALWQRSAPHNISTSTFKVVTQGPDLTPCLRMDIQDLNGWDFWHSPKISPLFGQNDTLFTFLAKGCERTSLLAVEMIEEDGSRWIATAALTTEWQRVSLRSVDFKYWYDSSVKNRRQAGDQFNPQAAVRLSFGLSKSHTPTVPSGRHTLWIADVGSARDPLLAALHKPDNPSEYIETIFPSYKVHVMTGDLSVHPSDGFLKKGASEINWELKDKDVICAIPRPLGEGFDRNAPWRFLPLATASRHDGKTSGVCEWLLLNKRPLFNGQAVAGFGYTDPAIWSSPSVIDRIAQVATRLSGGMLFEEGGTRQFAYWPGESVQCGACVRTFDKKLKEATVECEIRKGAHVLWHKRFKQEFVKGVGKINFAWQPPIEAAEYIVEIRLVDNNSSIVDVIQHSFAVLDTIAAAKDAFITARDGDFWLNNKKWYPVGINFWPLYVSGMETADYNSGWLRDAYYSPFLVERDMKHMADIGINMVSIQTPPLNEHRNLLHFLRLCHKYDMHANLFMGQASPLAFNEVELKLYLEAARIPGNSTVFAYDTIWEPGNHVFKNDAARSKWDDQWRAWIEEQYGTVANAEKNWAYKARRNSAGEVISPPDKYFSEDGDWRGMMAAYRRFMDNLTSRKWNSASRRLRALDPNHLISFRQGNTLPYDFALTGPVKHIDFICPEGYAIRNTDNGEAAIGFITRYVHHTTGGKPIIWSEFGQSVWDQAQMKSDYTAIQEQGVYSERFYRTALRAGANGTAPWWWPGGYRVNEQSDFGVVETDRTERPAAQLIRQYAPRFKEPRPKPQPDIWMTYDRDAHAGGYCWSAFNEGAAAYQNAASRGTVLGIRTPGTGHDSSTVPLTAVGNVPCDGTNPPKYLDAEFNFLQVIDATGVWCDVIDGSEIKVAAGKSVRIRASLGNLQAATWLPFSETGDQPGGVALVARSAGIELSSQPIKARVPYLADAEFDEFTVPLIQKKTSISLQLEARGRTPFGESRIFALFNME